MALHAVASDEPAAAEFEPEALSEEDPDSPKDEERSKKASYRLFMDTIGSKYQYASPESYLGKTPFPMNPSFQPPPPISDKQKEAIYRLYLSHRLENGPRRLAKRYNISFNRVKAILRLKLLEQNFETRERTLQTGFQVGMDRLLGATTHSSVHAIADDFALTARWLDKAMREGVTNLKDIVNVHDPTHPDFMPPDINDARSDVHKADMLEQEEQRDAAPSRYERLYWESVPEDGREPLLPSILQTVKQEAELKQLTREVKNSKKFLVRTPQTEFIRRPTMRSYIVGRSRGRQGRVTKFVDVGGHFMDLDSRIRALGVSKNRAKRRQRQAA